MISAPLRYDRASSDGFRRLRQRLEDIGYAPGAVAELLRLREVEDLYPLDYRFLPRWDESVRRATDNLSPSVRLLLLGLPEDFTRLESTLGAEHLELLLVTGLAFREGTSVHPRLSIIPFENILVATDRLFMNADQESAEEGLSSDNCVWRLDRTTLIMSKRSKKGKVEKALELGCGSGVLSLLAAKEAENITGIDINPRAVNVAGFNARLNGIDNVEYTQGDLFQSVKGKRFDHIFSNPPSAPGLVRAWNREGGASGREMVEDILRGLDGHLAPGGTFQATMHFGYREKGDIESWAGGFLDSRRYGISYEFVGDEETAGSYALREAYQKAGPRDYGLFERAYRMYFENLKGAGIEKLSFGLLTVVEH